MSWELMGTYKKPCSCGKGFIIEEHYMDDWNRTKENVYFDCEDCKERQIKEQIKQQNKRNEMQKGSTKILTYFKEKYLDLWVSHFKDMKSKKLIWETTYALGIETSSLSTFYSYNRTLSLLQMRTYYDSLVKIQNIPQIIKVLNIKDEYIESTLPELLLFYEEQRNAMYSAAYASYRKKR